MHYPMQLLLWLPLLLLLLPHCLSGRDGAEFKCSVHMLTCHVHLPDAVVAAAAAAAGMSIRQG
jgi:hypothetical protein